MLSQASHNDQQIRGLVRLVIGNVISASLVEDNYLLVENDHHLLNKTFLTELVGFLLQVIWKKQIGNTVLLYLFNHSFCK